jgi:hypothetical protein
MKLKSTRFGASGILCLIMLVLFACQNDAKQEPSLTRNAAGSGKGKGVTTHCVDSKNTYTITTNRYTTANLNGCFTYSNPTTTFEWTITFQKGTQAVSHFNIILLDCVDFTDILSVYVLNNATSHATDILMELYSKVIIL